MQNLYSVLLLLEISNSEITACFPNVIIIIIIIIIIITIIIIYYYYY